MRRHVALLISFSLVNAGCDQASLPLKDPELQADASATPVQFQDTNEDVLLSETAPVVVPEILLRIDPGSNAQSALTALDRLGYTKESFWQWGSTSPDAKYACRTITDGVLVVLYYSDESKLITGVAMMFVPPDYSHRGNYQVISVDSISFSEDGAYTVEFPRPTSDSSK